MKRDKDIVPILISAVLAILGLLAVLVIVAPNLFPLDPITPTAILSDTSTPSPHPIITVRPTYTPKPPTTPYPTIEFSVPPSGPADYNGPIPAGAIARLGKGNIKAMAITNDKKFLIVGGNIGLYAYRIEDFQEVWASPVSSEVRDIAINPADNTLVTGMYDGSIAVWDSQTGDRLYTLADRHDYYISQVAYNSAGTLMASASNDSIVMIWDAQTGALIQTLDPGHEGIGRIAWLPGEDKLMIGSRYVTIWDVTNAEFTFTSTDYRQGITGFVLAPDNTLLIELANGGYSIMLREAYSGQLVHELTGYIAPTMSRGAITSVSPDNTLLAVGGGNGLITLWDLTTGHMLAALSGHVDEIVSVEFGQDSNTLYSSAEDGQIIEWDIQMGKPVRAIRDHSPLVRMVESLAWSPDNSTLAYAYYGGMPHLTYPDEKLAAVYDTVLLWDRADQTYTALPAQNDLVDIRSIAYSPDGSLLAVGPQYAPAILWDVETLQPQITSFGGECCITFSHDGELLASGMLTSVSIGDGHTGKMLRSLGQVSLPGIYDLEFNLDNIRLFVGTGSGISIIDAVSGELVDQFDTQDEMVHSVALNQDGTKLAAGLHNGSIVLWDIDTKTRILELTGHTQAVRDVTWSPDGRFILSGSDDGLAVVWDAQTGEQLYTLDGHAFGIASVAWSPDGQYIATGSHDGTVVIWEAQ